MHTKRSSHQCMQEALCVRLLLAKTLRFKLRNSDGNLCTFCVVFREYIISFPHYKLRANSSSTCDYNRHKIQVAQVSLNL